MTWEDDGPGGRLPPKPEHVFDALPGTVVPCRFARQRSPIPFHRATVMWPLIGVRRSQMIQPSEPGFHPRSPIAFVSFGPMDSSASPPAADAITRP